MQVKLVGSTISCEGAHEFGGVSGRGRHNPHVQSYVVATDQVSNGCIGVRPLADMLEPPVIVLSNADRGDRHAITLSRFDSGLSQTSIPFRQITDIQVLMSNL